MLSCFVVNPITTHVIDNAGVSSSDLSYVQLANLLSQYLMDNPSQYLLFCLPLLCSALMLGIMIFVGVRANRMYLNHCVRTVQEIKSVSQYGNRPFRRIHRTRRRERCRNVLPARLLHDPALDPALFDLIPA